jgi:hypothetical protein
VEVSVDVHNAVKRTSQGASIAENDNLEINNVEIADVLDSVSDELTEAEQEKVTGGGEYLSPGTGNYGN